MISNTDLKGAAVPAPIVARAGDHPNRVTIWSGASPPGAATPPVSRA